MKRNTSENALMKDFKTRSKEGSGDIKSQRGTATFASLFVYFFLEAHFTWMKYLCLNCFFLIHNQQKEDSPRLNMWDKC